MCESRFPHSLGIESVAPFPLLGFRCWLEVTHDAVRIWFIGDRMGGILCTFLMNCDVLECVRM